MILKLDLFFNIYVFSKREFILEHRITQQQNESKFKISVNKQYTIRQPSSQMGPHQSSQHYNHTNIHQLFPQIKQYHPIGDYHQLNSHNCSYKMYKHVSCDKIATIRNYHIRGSKKPFTQAYYLQRCKIKNNPHLFQLIDVKVSHSQASRSITHEPSTDVSGSLCSMKTLRSSNNSGASYIMWLFCQSSALCLEDQIANRVNKKSFQEIELWSVLSSCVLGSMTLLEQGFKEPVLSPKGIGLSKDGLIKVGQWEIVSNLDQNYLSQEGQVIVGKYGQAVSQINKNSLNELLLNYYWAPQGLRAMENFISLGQKQSPIISHSHRNANLAANHSQKFQIFSLGMTLISMCLRSCFYRTDTFSQKYLSKLTHQAIQIRKVEGKQLSNEMKLVIQSMVKWDPQQRITYSQLRDIILQYFTEHQDQMNNSSVSIKTFDYLSQSDECKNAMVKKNQSKNQSRSLSQNTSMNLTQEHSFVDSYSFAVAQANLKIQSKVEAARKQSRSSQHASSTSSAFEGYEGSGMVEQGTGDNDQNLQQQKQQIPECDEILECQQEFLSQPVTHRTQKSLKQQIKSKNNNPYKITVSPQRQNICPTSTPNINPSPRPCSQINKIGQQSKNNAYLIPYKNQIQDKKKSYEYRTNQVYLMEDDQNEVSIPKLIKSRERYTMHQPRLQIQTDNKNQYLQNEDFMAHSVSNRGSYRCRNKQPPTLKSARPYTDQISSSYTMHSQTRPSLQPKNKESISAMPVRHQLIIKYAYGAPAKAKQLQTDEQDLHDYGFEIDEISLDNEEEIENPDIFQTFQLNSENTNSCQNSIIADIIDIESKMKKQINPNTSYGCISKQFFKKSLPNFLLTENNNQNVRTKQEQNIITSLEQTKLLDQKTKNAQFMTFNESQPKTIQNNFHQINLQNPQKWKNDTNENLERQIKKDNEKLFTDPKLLQYIKSSIQPYKKNSMEITSRFNTNQLFGSINSSIKQIQGQRSNYQSKDKQNSIFYCNNTQQIASNKEINKKNSKFQDIFSSSYNKNDYSRIDGGQNNIFDQVQQLNSPTKSKIVKEQVSKGFYEGEKKNGIRSGYGVFYYNEGGKYKGNWLNNKMHGKGTLQYSDGRIAYQGEWSCDQLHGKGILYNQSPNCVSQGLNYEDLDQLDECWIYYEGLFQHDDKSGIGMLRLSNDEQFIGQFKNDMANGVGQYLRIDGTVVKGIWNNNKLVKIIPN